MTAQTSMLHIRVDEKIKTEAAEKLAEFGLSLSDAVRILLTRITKEGGLPIGLPSDSEIYNDWFRGKVQEALEDLTPAISHQNVMNDVQERIEKKRARA